MDNDLISREALLKAIKGELNYASATAFVKTINKSRPVDLVYAILDIIENAPSVEVFTENDKALAYCEGYVRGSHEAYIRPQGDIRWTDKLSVTSSGDIIDFEGRVLGHINLEDVKGEE